MELEQEGSLRKLEGKIRAEPRHLFAMPVVFSLGSGGGRILAGVDVSRVGAIKVAVNSSLRDLKQIEDHVDVIIKCGDGGGSGMKPEKGREDYLGIADDIPGIVEKACEIYGCEEPDVIVTIASLGHGFGSGSLPEHARLIKERFPNAVHLIFGITPFYFEGDSAIIRAYNSLKETVKHNTVFLLSNQIASVKARTDPMKLKLSEVYNNINERISHMLTNFFEALTTTEGVMMGLDRADLKNVIQGEIGGMGMVKYPSLEGLSAEKLLNDVMATIYMKPIVEGPGIRGTYILDSKDSVPISLLNSLNTILITKWLFKTDSFKPLVIERRKEFTSFILLMAGMSLKKQIEKGLDILVFGLETGEYWSKAIAKGIKKLFKRKEGSA
ncbi:MAG: hypothetical protein DRJ97_05280 [Thermoprotei archaeon]|nr:MAG: hypothetical protein DRJ97_05280 [Thermoprotei archaeon]